MSPKVRVIMGSFAVFFMVAIFIVLVIQRHLHSQAYSQAAKTAVPALSPIHQRSLVKYKKWMGPVAEKGKVIYLNFWASWCEPCKEELSYIEELSHELKGEGLKVLLVNLDSVFELELAKQIKGQFAPSLTSVYEAEAKPPEKKINFNALPRHALIDRSGRVANSFFGSVIRYKKYFKNQVQELLAEKVSP